MVFLKSVFFRKQVLLGQLMVLAFLGFSTAWADVKLPAIIDDNMVIQRDAKVIIWGSADPEERVTLSFAGQKTEAIADAEGRWIIDLKPMEAGGPYEMIIEGENSITLQNILVGEVWVCSGQSNMQWPVRASINAEQEMAEADFPMIRLFGVKRIVSEVPLTDVEGLWQACNSETVGNFSAVGYFFGRDLHKQLGVPVGLINSSWGGTPAEAWTSMKTLKSDPEFRPILDRWEQILEKYPQAEEEYQQKLAEWEQESQKAKDEGRMEPIKPQPPIGPNHPHRPSSLFNGMIAPLIPLPIKGVIWYQGESNAGRAYQYRKLFSSMISDWRAAWGQGDFPFLFVQLANFEASKPPPVDSAWSELREAQTMTLSLPKTGMAVAIDIGEAKDIHPKNKQDVGHRLALAASAIAYDQNIEFSGPVYDSMIIEKDKIRLYFKHTNRELITKDGEQPRGFAIAGRDQRFIWAKAIIEGDTVLVWHEKVPQPIAVRYAWGDNPDCNLYNSSGLPALPFRTDQWPGITINEQ